MGINGLLKGLSPLLIPENETSTNGKINTAKPLYNIRQFKNKTVAIDASSWLYKACYSASDRLVEAIEAGKIDHICEKILCRYMTKRCDELLNFAGIRRVRLVFDGKRCPLKAVTNREREARRMKNLTEARRLMRLGMKDQAIDKYKACVKVVPWMAESVAKAVAQKWKKQNGFGNLEPQVTCIFSPYEADAQLVKLCVDGLADAVITEDSDVLVYSAACMHSFPIIYKLDRNSGSCDVISMDWLLVRCPSSKSLDHEGNISLRRLLPSQLQSDAANANANQKNNTNSKSKKGKNKAAGGALLSHLTAMATREARNAGSGVRLFVQACTLSGCDYAPSRVSGMGLVTAFKTVKENIHRDPHCRFSCTLKSISKEKLANDPFQQKSTNDPREEYEELLAKSECVFYFHRVLDRAGKIVPLVQSDLPQLKDEAHEFLPKLDRFDDDTFIGTNYANTGEQDVQCHKRSHSSIVESSKPLDMPVSKVSKIAIKNPYEKKKAPKTNMFSYFAHNTTSNSAKKASQLGSFSKKSSPVIPSPKVTLSPQLSNDIDLSSDDEIDDVLLPVSQRSVESNKPNRVEVSSSSIDSSDDELDEILQPTTTRKQHEDTKSMRSKYFFSDIERTSANTLQKENIGCHDPNEAPTVVTPTMADLEAQMDATKSCHDELSDEGDSLIPISTIPASTKDFPIKTTQDDFSDDDDDDCIIIESVKPTRPSILRTSQRSQSRSSTFSSTFAKAQGEGTRARLASRMKKSNLGGTKSNGGALGRPNKKARTGSIRGFFTSLPSGSGFS
jgi:5'-3' exonuclease